MLSENAKKIVESRYFLEGEESEWEQLARRVGTAIANGEKWYAEPFAEMINDMKFIPGGRILRNAGRIRGSLFNCYHLPIGDSIDEIGDCAANALKLWSDGGGVGINFSSLRPTGAAIKGLGGKSSGLVSFMRAIDGLAACIESGGSRRAASLGSCDVSHPEIEQFIDAKLVDGSISYFNISVNITKDFLEAVMRDSEWPLTFRGKSYNKLSAVNLWQKILSNMIASAEPGLLVWDNLIKNNSYYFAPITGCNPCLTGDTLIETTMGQKQIKDLTKYKQVDVYTRLEDGSIGIRPATFWRTKPKAKCIYVLTNRGVVKCTPDHKFITLTGEIEAQNLKPNDRLIGILRRKKNATHVEVSCTGAKYYKNESRFVVEHYFKIPVDCDVHHIDGDRLNNSIENLQVIPHSVHSIKSNRGHIQWNKTNKKGQFVSKQTKKKKTPTKTFSSKGSWRVLKVSKEIFYEPVFDGSVVDTNCFFANGVLVHNCGEATLAPYDVCDLGSLVLSNFVDSGGRTKWSDLETTIDFAIRFLDNVIEVNKYRLESNRRMASTGRRIGLGVMGLAEYLFAKKVRYGTPAAISAVEDLMRAIRDYAYSASIRLAIEKGSFPAFDKVQYHKASFIRKLPVSLRKDILDYGIRNVTVLALAPTGTISLIPEVTNSIEPLFSKAYKRKDRVGERIYIHPLTSQFDTFPDWFVSTEDLDPEDHLNIQVACQKYIDGAVSKTINLPSNYTVDNLSNVLFEYLFDIKGVTVYRDGCREGQILNHLNRKEIAKIKKAESSLAVEDAACSTGACEI